VILVFVFHGELQCDLKFYLNLFAISIAQPKLIEESLIQLIVLYYHILFW